jgi:hypothetical protein
MISLTCLRIFTAVRTYGWAAWVWVLLLSTSKESPCCRTTTGQLIVLFLTASPVGTDLVLSLECKGEPVAGH